MNRFYKIILLLITISICFMALTACDFLSQFIDNPSDVDPPTPVVDPDPVYYTVEFYDGDVLLASQSLEEGTILNPVPYDKQNDNTFTYTFYGWDCNGDGNIEAFPYTINANVTFVAVYSSEYVNYHYNIYNRGELVKSIDCHYGDLIDYPTINSSIEGDDVYFFLGWKYNGKDFDGYTINNVVEDLNIVACYAESQILKYYYQGALYAKYVQPDVELSYLNEWNILPPQGYDIVWYEDAEYLTPFAGNSMVTGNLTLYGIDERQNRGILVSSDEDILRNFNQLIIDRDEKISFDLAYEVQDLNALSAYITKNSISLYNYTLKTYYERKYLEITVTFEPIATTSSTQAYYDQFDALDYNPNKTPYTGNLYIDSVADTYLVKHTDALFHALEYGYRPVIKDDDVHLVNLYNKIKDTARQIVANDYTDLQKVIAIYEYLVMNVTYDKEVLDYTVAEQTGVAKYNSFYLEGVFDDKIAVCDGISKAFVCLCRVLGIECVRITGKIISSDVGHAWNKVKLDGKWYICDATSGGCIVDKDEAMSHAYLLISEDKYKTYAKTDGLYYNDYVCNTDYNVYNILKLSDGTTSLTEVINSEDDAVALIKLAKSIVDNLEEGSYTFDVKFNIEGDIDEFMESVLTKAEITDPIGYVRSMDGMIFIISNQEQEEE